MLTPVQRRGGFAVKRDDLFEYAGVRGGKVRGCLALAAGAVGLVTAGSRSSPQCNIVAAVGRALGVPVRLHCPSGQLSPELQLAAATGAEVVQHPAGYNTVIVARAREDAAARGWTEIPFGMECPEAVVQTRRQAANIPDDAQRLVVPVGSGMSLSGILWGLVDAGRELPVLGVVVGADPTERLNRYAPPDWARRVTLVPSGVDYGDAVTADLDGVRLDPIYEAKCVQFLQPGDCLWVVGVRASVAAESGSVPPGRREFAGVPVTPAEPADLVTLDLPAVAEPEPAAPENPKRRERSYLRATGVNPSLPPQPAATAKKPRARRGRPRKK